MPNSRVSRHAAASAGDRHEHDRAEDQQAATRRDQQARGANPWLPADDARHTVHLRVHGFQLHGRAEQVTEPGDVGRDAGNSGHPDDHAGDHAAANAGARGQPDEEAHDGRRDLGTSRPGESQADPADHRSDERRSAGRRSQA